jgi:phosphatidylglycerophosphatase A
MTAGTPDWRFLVSHPAHFVALGFGAGLAPVAPGTFGTLLAIPIAMGLNAQFADLGYLVAVAAFGVIGIWAASVTGEDLGAADHGAIVWDEVVAFLLVLFFTGTDGIRMAFAFLLFRFFDIVKPPPIRQLDAALHSGVGVMADDLLAAGYTLLALAVGQRIVE